VVAKVVVILVSVAVIGAIIGLVASRNNSSAKATASPSPSVAAKASSSSSDKLQVTDNVVGTGAEAVTGKTVNVSYTGTLANGTVFDSTAKDGGKPFSFTLGQGQVIKGWDQGVVGMKVGGTRTLVIPPDLAYGSQGAGSTIPPNATLTFKIQLLSVQ
jgi:FKBP-type peptidyl-prolyl cis-trans isomerase